MATNDIKITNLNTNVTRTLTYAQNGKIECDNGVLSWKYVNGSTSSYRKIIFKDGTFRQYDVCLLYTSPSPRDGLLSRMPSSA